MKQLVSTLAFSLIACLAMANDIKGKVVEVIDGNTLQVMGNDGKTYNVLLSGIDCPELKQAYGDEARLCLLKLTLGKQVDLKILGKDRLGNAVAELLVNGKKDPRIQLLNEGLAWTSEKTPESNLEMMRVTAQTKKKGLWKEENPTPPWVYRRQQSLTGGKTSI
jgi:endonuclease YncB( thermonuclease family)